MYRIDTRLEIGDFIVDARTREQLGLQRNAREQLLLSEDARNGEVSMGLFIEDGVLDNLHIHDPGHRLHSANFGDFLLVVEGVSHFVYAAWRARSQRSVSALELEVQAEIDKYITCLLMLETTLQCSHLLRRRLFEQFSFEDDLDAHELLRYQTANTNGHRYSASLERRYVRRRRIADMLGELRRFYRMSLTAKLDFISTA